MTRKLTLIVAAIGTAGIGATAAVSAMPGASGAISLLASQTSPSPSPGAQKTNPFCQAFVNHLRQDLGVSQDKLSGSFKEAVDQTIDDAVKAGKITAAQATKLKVRVENRPVCAGFNHRFARPALAGAMKAYLDAAAVALHFSSTADLTAQLKSGHTLSQIAASRGVSEQQFRSSVISQLKPKLDQLRDQKKITQAQEDKVIDRLQNGELPLWNKAPHRAAAGTASPTPTTS
jgi:uncharacterized protein YidB (DUF937 family)